MSKLKTYSEFINEGMIDAIKNPIKWKKIKNNAKKFQKAKVAHALNDVDYAKKLAQSDSKKETDVLKKTNAVKNTSLKDIQSNIGTRMDDLATTPGLKQVVKLAKTTSNLAANKIIIKAATGEQAKQLKIRQKELVGKVSAAKNALKDYETTEKPKKEDGDPNKEKIDTQVTALRDKRTPLIQAKSETDDKQKVAELSVQIEEINVKIADLEGDDSAGAKEDLKSAKERLAKITGTPDEGTPDEGTTDDSSTKLESDIKGYNKSIEEERAIMTKTMKELDQANIDKKLGRVSDEAIQKIQKRIEDSKEDIAELKKKEADAKKKLGAMQKESVTESYVPLVESVSAKFKRLRPNL